MKRYTCDWCGNCKEHCPCPIEPGPQYKTGDLMGEFIVTILYDGRKIIKRKNVYYSRMLGQYVNFNNNRLAVKKTDDGYIGYA
jgi:hypothetical protein